jgi:signal transduction histidine kinase
MIEQTIGSIDDEQRDARSWHRFNVNFNRFWTVVTYIIVGLNLYDTTVDAPDRTRGWYLVGLIALICSFFIVYHLAVARAQRKWPVPLRLVALYGTVQTLVLALLFTYNPSFGGLGIATSAHVMALLPPRFWPIPITALILLLSAAWGVLDDVRSANWDDVGFKLLQPALWVAMFIFLNLFIRKSYQQRALVSELRRTQAELERNAIQAEELAALRERTRLAREMHDSIGHALVVVNIKLEAAERLYAKDFAKGAAELDATRGLVRETMADLRRSLANLRSPLPGHHDLPSAIQRLVYELRDRTQLDVQCSIADDLPLLPPEVTEAVWCVAKEALSNVERHAAAVSVAVALNCHEGTVVLRIADDGSGIDPHAMRKPGHFGIVGMSERMVNLGGSLRLDERAGGGTVVEAQLHIKPLKQNVVDPPAAWVESPRMAVAQPSEG